MTLYSSSVLPISAYSSLARKLLFCNMEKLYNSLSLVFGFSETSVTDLVSKSSIFASSDNSSNVFAIRKSGFHLLTPSPWPIFSSFAAFLMLTGFAAYMNYYEGGLFCFYMGVFMVILAFLFWCRDLIRELTFLSRASILIVSNIRFAFWLFIVSEAMLFFSFFWAFFHSALEPAIQLGTVWPPLESIQMNNLLIPTANTVFLLTSGAALTWTQYGLIAGQAKDVSLGFVFIFFYASLFMFFQWYEYAVAFHQVNDSTFGSTLYILTMFHGGHVLIGSIFLFVCLIRALLGHLRPTSYLSLTLAGWYWHFVDAIWIIVYLVIYLWGTWIPFDFLTDFIENFTKLF